jgi:magnesium transporter
MPLTRLYRRGTLELEGFPISEVSDYLKENDAVVWFDLCEPTAQDLAAISDELGVHPLAVEDAAEIHQRPKVDHYATHLFLTIYSTAYDAESDAMTVAEVAAFITKRALVTVRKTRSFDIAKLLDRWDSQPQLAGSGVGFLVHGLLDYVVDTQFDTIAALDGEVEKLEDEVFSDQVRDAPLQRRTFEMRKSLVMLRKVVQPMREVVNTFMRRDLEIIDSTIVPYMQDVYDHVLQASERVESLRDLIGNVHETHLTVRGNRLNVITKQVTSWAAIIAIPTAITGFYGQNIPYPGFGKSGGFYASTGIIVVLMIVLYVMFKRKGWL